MILLENYGRIYNMSECIGTLRRLANLDSSFPNTALTEKINRYSETMISDCLEYRNSDFKETKTERSANYLLVKCGYCTENNEAIYFQFTRAKRDWVGAYVGTISQLEYKFKKTLKLEKKDTDSLDPNFVRKVYDRVLHKVGWLDKDDEPTYLGCYLYYYRKFYEYNLSLEMKGSKTKIHGKYIINKDRNLVIFNLNLFDTYIHDLRVICEYIDGKINYKSIVNSKEELINLGFSYDDVKRLPKGVVFYKNTSDLIMSIDDISEYDFENSGSIRHVIESRISRFPKELQSLPIDYLSTQLQKSLEYSVRMIKKDYKYAIPMYSISDDSIQFLVPFYITNSYLDKPEMALIIRKKTFWEVATILSMDSAYTNSRIISLQNNSWITVENE